MTRVVITSAGVLSPIGVGFESFAASLKAGRSGGSRISLFDPEGFPTSVAAEVKGFDENAPFQHLEACLPDLFTGVIPSQDRKTALGLAAALQCASQVADLTLSEEPCALHLGTGLSSVTMDQLNLAFS